ncbi:MAG TPA: GNAT family N-acetyltransferase [Candidatus Acidoferrales bacterium]|nr:GNAT family N-acetyltransferase [Candidatus Acidoferrales bacterium]
MPFELQPTLRGDLVTLRPLRAEDWDVLFSVASDPLIWEQHPQRDRYKEEVFREYFRGAMESGGAFLVLDAMTGEVIGSTRYYEYHEAGNEIEIGWTFLARPRWGGAYNREMKQLLVKHALRFVDAVVFRVGMQNMRSQRAMEKIGGIRSGTRPDVRGEQNILFKITRASFAQAPAAST